MDLPPRRFDAAKGSAGSRPTYKAPTAVPAVAPSPSFQIDEAAVDTALQESRRATAFVESLGEEPDDASPAPSPVIVLTDGEWRALRALIEEQPRSRSDLDALCRTRELFTFAFIDRINDLAIERTGEPAVYLDGDVVLDISTLTMITNKEPIA